MYIFIHQTDNKNNNKKTTKT